MKKISLYSLSFLVLLVFSKCAKMGSLTGGPRDEEPPKLVSSEPENYSINFDDDRIEITFDEYIQLDNVNQELVVSPPLENKTDVRLKNKSILIELENELRPNTTYTLNFGGAIKDNNEGNPLTNFEFVFSTGDYLDSLSVAGKLLNAFDLKPPEESIEIMLYDDLSDSVVFKDIPVYIGKTEEDGSYRINNLKSDTFKIFALKDVNNNFIFDLPNEQIAFLDTSLIIDPEFFSRVIKEEKDSTAVDTAGLRLADSLNVVSTDSLDTELSDSLRKQSENIAPDRLMVDLYLFTEDNETQFLADYNRSERKKLDFSFNLPVTDSFHYESFIPGDNNWYLEEVSSDRDSFILWVVNDDVSSMDTIAMELNYTVTDSMNQQVTMYDTLFFTYREPSRSGREKNDEGDDKNLMNLQTFKNNETLDLNEKVKFISETPVNYVDTSFIEFYKQVDTLEFRESYNIFKDTASIRKYVFDKEWESEGKYHFIAYPGAFMDVYGATTDTIDVRFSIREEGYYGTLIVRIDTVTVPLIVQLMDTNEDMIREVKLSQSYEVNFPFLKPGKYKVKIIYDENGNGEWDTGKYIEKLQPEKVQFFEGEIDVRANWEMAINFKALHYTVNQNIETEEGSLVTE